MANDEEQLNVFGELIYGLNKNNELVTVDEVDGQTACGCICPYCNKPLTAKKGNIRSHHFSHLPNQTCNYHNKINAIKLALKRVINGVDIRTRENEYIGHIKHFKAADSYSSVYYQSFSIETEKEDVVLIVVLKNTNLIDCVIKQIIQELKKDVYVVYLTKYYRKSKLTEDELKAFLNSGQFMKYYSNQPVSICNQFENEIPIYRRAQNIVIAPSKKSLTEWAKIVEPKKNHLFSFRLGQFQIFDLPGQYAENGPIFGYRILANNKMRPENITLFAHLPDWIFKKEII